MYIFGLLSQFGTLPNIKDNSVQFAAVVSDKLMATHSKDQIMFVKKYSVQLQSELQ